MYPPPGKVPPTVRMMRLGVEQHQAGRLAEAEAAYRKVLEIEPRNPDALHLLGLIDHQQDRADQAAKLIERALMIKPGEATFMINLGIVYRTLGKLKESEQVLRRAVATAPKSDDAHASLGGTLRAMRRLDEAADSTKIALSLNPLLHAAHTNVGNILKERGKLEPALEALQCADQLGAPKHESLNNIGEVYRMMGRWNDARAALEESIRLRGNLPVPHWNLSILLLLLGEYERGFAEYEWRLARPGAEGNRHPQPKWDGSRLAEGKTILLHPEQGFGDAIHFVRYAPLVAERSGARVTIECQPVLKRLFATVAGVTSVYATGESLPAFDVQLPMLSAPHALRTTRNAIPADVPYVKPDPELVGRWRGSIRALSDASRRKVGLVWAGNPHHTNDRNRSIAAELLAPLSSVQNVDWYSLQAGPAATNKPPLRFVELGRMFEDFADTAALLSQLDLLITVDTSVAHLGGALARPTWVLLPAFPDWRWLLNRSDSPWYPTVRIFRQRRVGDWEGVIADVAAALRANG